MNYPKLDYKKGGAKKDACYHKIKASSKVWPSAYASGRLVQCRKVGASNYGKSKKEMGGLKDPRPNQKGLKKLPTAVRNKMGYKKKGGFPDLTGDGKVTRADILKGRGVIKKRGGVKKCKYGC